MKSDCAEDNHVHFMDIDGDGRKDYACVDDSTGKTTAYRNREDAEWEDLKEVATGQTVPGGRGVMFAEYVFSSLTSSQASQWAPGAPPLAMQCSSRDRSS